MISSLHVRATNNHENPGSLRLLTRRWIRTAGYVPLMQKFLPDFFFFLTGLLEIFKHRIILYWCEGEVAQSCPTLCDLVDWSLLGSSVHVSGLLQARILEWVAISFSRGSSWPRHRNGVSSIADRCFTLWATREAQYSTDVVRFKISTPEIGDGKRIRKVVVQYHSMFFHFFSSQFCYHFSEALKVLHHYF